MRNGLWVAVVVGVAGLGYWIGREAGPSSPAREPVVAEEPAIPASSAGGAEMPATVSEPERPAAAPDAAPPTAEKGAPPPHPAVTAAASPRHDFVQFQLGRRNVKALLPDGPNLWIGTSGGVVRYEPGTDTHTTYDNRNALLSNGVFYLGKKGRELLVGTYGGGLSVLDTDTGEWRNYNIPNGMADAFVYDVLRASSGDIWIATWSGANRVIDGRLDDIESWRLYTVENTEGGLPNDWVYGLAEGKDGEIWLATEGGLARFSEGRWTNWDHADGLGAPYDLVESDTGGGRAPGKVSAHHARQKKAQGLAGIAAAYNPNYIVSMAVDGDGSVWAGTWGAGLSHFDGARWRTFTTRDGLPGNHVFALEIDPAGRLWVGTNRGLARFEDGRFVAYDRRSGLFSDNVFSIAFAADGGLWVGSYGGLSWFPKGIGVAAAGGANQ